MPRLRSMHTLRVLSATMCISVALACDGTNELSSGPQPGEPDFARAAAGPVVSATTPSYGMRGETNKTVTVTGSGFSAGATVAWERSGVADPKITVHSATVVSSSRIDAVITIASDAELALYDVSVTNSDRKKGVGTEAFEITTAQSIGTLGSSAVAYGANDNTTGARVVGYSSTSSGMRAFYWPKVDGTMGDLGPGEAQDIDQNGNTIAGSSGGWAVIWTLSGSTWTMSQLPIATGGIGSGAAALVSDALGDAVIIGGSESVPAVKGHGKYGRPRLWRKINGVWTVTVLPTGSTSSAATSGVSGVNAAGQAVGSLRVNAGASQAMFWDVDGSYTILPGPAGSAASGGINAAGTVVAGMVDNANAVYWTAVVNGDGTRTWSGPFTLPGSCARAVGIDDNGVIVGNRCLVGNTRYVSAIWAPPYDAASMTTLTGLGIKTDAGAAWAISPNGTLLAGTASTSGSNNVAVIWTGGAF